MFTGIVEEIGQVKTFKQKTNLSVLTVSALKASKGIGLGDSVAVNGVCLTVTDIKKNNLSFDLMSETLKSTNLNMLKEGSAVNLESAMKANSRVNGHFVTGHVDEVGILLEKIEDKNYLELRISYPAAIKKFLVKKGSVCLDGVSLTIGEVTRQYFSVYLIPFTKDVTTLGKKAKKAKINIEIDILARYIQNLAKR